MNKCLMDGCKKDADAYNKIPWCTDHFYRLSMDTRLQYYNALNHNNPEMIAYETRNILKQLRRRATLHEKYLAADAAKKKGAR